MVAGLAIGWYFKSSGTEVNAICLVSPFGLAFVARYSVERLFTAMDDRIGTAFSGPDPKAPDPSPKISAFRLGKQSFWAQPIRFPVNGELGWFSGDRNARVWAETYSKQSCRELCT